MTMKEDRGMAYIYTVYKISENIHRSDVQVSSKIYGHLRLQVLYSK